ncbi:class I adenylate-forming enzyme family protein [Natronomonas gomsonensis]|uniref:class I adenylate-forming enzyme family protein n=1 Tax=Natronomonas gomsonensis TaxID=1046043 RepID=UPI0015C053DC|nr:long-chain fatty acid--CoA ligase [Natronomonas gomsonensis]
MTNLLADIEQRAAEMPDATAIGFRGQELSYGEFWSQTGRFAKALADSGVEPGDRVGVYLPNLPQYVIAFHGILRAGGIVVPMNPQYKSREISHLLGDSGATAVVALADLVPQVQEVQDDTDVHTIVSVGGDTEGAVEFDDFLAEEELDVVDRDDDDVACQPYTSGTTGTPKGVLLTHRNLAFEARASPKIHDGIYDDDKMLGVLPLFHIYGMTVTMLATLYEGGSYWPMAEWDAEAALELVESEGITLFHGVPAMYNDLVNHPKAAEYDLGSVRFANAGGSSLPLEVMRQFEETFEPDLMEGYGLTETAPVTHANRPDDRRPGSIGKPLPGVESKVVDHDFEEVDPVPEGPVDDETALDDVVGEIVVSGPNVMKEYYNRPGANEEAFTYDDDGTRWFHTGDLGYYDEDGFFFIVDREKHMIVTGGYNVYPREVEELLFEHPDIADAAVVGVPDERRGETVTAFVVKRPDAEVTAEEIKEYALDNLAAYKHPREVNFVDELPRTTTGKVQKFELEDFE